MSDIVFAICGNVFIRLVGEKTQGHIVGVHVGWSRDEVNKKAPANLSWGLYINK